MNERIVFADGTSFPCPEGNSGVVRHLFDPSRHWIALRLVCDLPVAKTMFSAGAVYRLEWESLTADGKGKETMEMLVEDLTEYSVPGDLIDHRDGTVSVYMGKPTELEKAELMLEKADALAVAAMEVVGGALPPAGLSEAAQAYTDEKKKHEKPKPVPPGGDGPKPRP